MNFLSFVNISFKNKNDHTYNVGKEKTIQYNDSSTETFFCFLFSEYFRFVVLNCMSHCYFLSIFLFVNVVRMLYVFSFSRRVYVDGSPSLEKTRAICDDLLTDSIRSDHLD